MTRYARFLTAIPILLALVRPAVAQPSPVLLVLNKIENTLAFVDPATGLVIGKVPTGEGPHVAVTGDNAIAVVDLETLQVIGRIETGTGPDGMAWVGR